MRAREIDLRFHYQFGDTPKAIGLVTFGLIDLKPLVSHRFSLEERGKGFQSHVRSGCKSG